MTSLLDTVQNGISPIGNVVACVSSGIVIGCCMLKCQFYKETPSFLYSTAVTFAMLSIILP